MINTNNISKKSLSWTRVGAIAGVVAVVGTAVGLIISALGSFGPPRLSWNGDVRVNVLSEGSGLNHYKLQLYFKNTGPTTAYAVNGNLRMTLLANGGQNIDMVYKGDDGDCDDKSTFMTSISPGDGGFYGLRRTEMTVDTSNGLKLIPNDVEIFSKEKSDLFYNKKAQIFVDGYVCYRDWIGIRHKSDICFNMFTPDDLLNLRASMCRSDYSPAPGEKTYKY